jgi:hypothetical protein
MGHLRIAEKLLEKGAKVTPDIINQAGENKEIEELLNQYFNQRRLQKEERLNQQLQQKEERKKRSWLSRIGFR